MSDYLIDNFLSIFILSEEKYPLKSKHYQTIIEVLMIESSDKKSPQTFTSAGKVQTYIIEE